MEIIDITAPISPRSVVWKGDVPPTHEYTSHVDRGDPNTVSRWSLGAHTGTHVDARLHFISGGWTMEALDLARVVGPCRVVDLTHVEGHLSRDDLESAGVAGTARLILKTRNSEQRLLERDAFTEGYAAISHEAAEYLVETGVETIGVDFLSVEPFEDGEFRTHHTLLGADLVILEGLALAGVEPGEYVLACLPIKLAGSDGAPARAILMREYQDIREGGHPVKAVVWNGPEKMAIEEVPEPEIAPGTVIVRPEAAGICGSEIEGYLGRMGNRTPPLVMGHEFAGTVTEIGEGVDESLLGRVVAVNPLSSDGTCPLCRAGHTNLCPNRRLVGIHSPGGFASYTLAPAENVYPLPEGVEARTGALAEPLANGVHAARLGLAGDHNVEHAVVVGAGTIGLMCLQAAVLEGIPNVSVVEPHDARREQARGLGATTAFASGEDAREALEGPTEGVGVDLVLDAVGAEVTRRMALDLIRPGGRIVFVGLHDDDTTLGFHDVVRGQLDLQGSYAFTASDYERALEWLVEGKAGIGELPPVLPLEEGPGAFAELVRGPSAQIKVFLAEKGE
ncbi:MAG: alcohol dehydrogenase catalytic domain-containing protein [Rubrobacter sp.]|nr:alcohol dehydrogenase catalytic domain-containing protein [Rubrobacter sp.]